MLVLSNKLLFVTKIVKLEFQLVRNTFLISTTEFKWQPMVTFDYSEDTITDRIL